MLLRYFHTVKHLKFSQVIGRIRQRMCRPRPDLRAPEPLRKVAGQWYRHCWAESSMVGVESFSFLNDTRQLTFPRDWNASDCTKLWLYNLHYFADLNALGAEDRNAWHETLMRCWIAENPPTGGIGWEPYPLSLRIVNWIKWALAGNALGADAIYSLAVQIRYLRRRLEFHLFGNHLFENAKALVFGGMYFSGSEAEAWLKTGKRLLEEQIQEQVLADGGHFELSPMYHSQILEGLLDLVNLHRAYQIDLPDIWQVVILRMLDWFRAMCHPDGDIAFFNDAALGVAPRLSDLERYSAKLGVTSRPNAPGSIWLDKSGYARLERGNAVLIADVAAVGPEYLPGHAHADSLSFELSLHGQRVLVNSGTSVYGVGLERLRQRGTAAHNTVRLDGVDSSEVWSGFRMARRAVVRVVRFDGSNGPVLEAEHDGYQRLKGKPVHRRQWLMRERELTLGDTIEGHGEHLVEIYFHFHPDLRPEASGASTFTIRRKDGSSALELYADNQMSWQIEPGSWHPHFGESQANYCLKGAYKGSLPSNYQTRLTW